MKTLLEKTESTLVREKSSFISILYHVTSENEVPFLLDQTRKNYPKAKHYCYAYKIGAKTKCSDDGEPSGTAGRPLLELLNKKDLDEVLLVVVRYFGGVLLGASRLLSTYVESGVLVINDSNLLEIENRYIYSLKMEYQQFEQLKRLKNRYGFVIENIQFNDKIVLDLLSKTDDINEIVNLFPNIEIEVNGLKKVYTESQV